MIDEIILLIQRIGLLEKSIVSLSSVGVSTYDLRKEIQECEIKLEAKKRQCEKLFTLARTVNSVSFTQREGTTQTE